MQIAVTKIRLRLHRLWAWIQWDPTKKKKEKQQLGLF